MPLLWGGAEPEAYLPPELHLKMLKAIHKCVLGDRTMYVFPRLHHELLVSYRESPWLLPESIHKKALRDPLDANAPVDPEDPPWCDVFPVPSPFARKPSWKRISSLAQILDINNLGYDIQVSVNPLTCKIVGQKTVSFCLNILAESDTGNIEDQLLALKPFRNEIVSILTSGRRSVHAVFRLANWIDNPHSLDWKLAKRAQDRHKLGKPIRDFVQAANLLKERLKKVGFWPDAGAMVNHCVFTRLPGFRHGKTGRISRLVYLNPNASRETPSSRVYVSKELKSLWEDGRKVSVSAVGSSVSIFQEDSQDDSQDDVSYDDSEKNNVVYRGGGDVPQGAGGFSKADTEAVKECGSPVPVNVYKNRSKASPSSSSSSEEKHNFLSDWATYRTLKEQGIPERHKRRGLHMPMFTIATIFGWDDNKLADECRNIVEINPRCIGCGEDEAVSDILAAWASRSRHEALRMPDLAELPDLDKRKSRILLEALKKERCPKPRIATRIVSEMLIPMGRKLPAQSKDGSLGLKSKEMLVKFGSGYRVAREGLVDAGLLEVTERSYRPGRQTMKYRVNWPKLLILCGYEAGELKWP
jgi:hypothetical protein